MLILHKGKVLLIEFWAKRSDVAVTVLLHPAAHHRQVPVALQVPVVHQVPAPVAQAIATQAIATQAIATLPATVNLGDKGK